MWTRKAHEDNFSLANRHRTDCQDDRDDWLATESYGKNLLDILQTKRIPPFRRAFGAPRCLPPSDSAFLARRSIYAVVDYKRIFDCHLGVSKCERTVQYIRSSRIRRLHLQEVVTMKLFTLFLTTAAVVLAQDTVSATGSGCEPHGYHW